MDRKQKQTMIQRGFSLIEVIIVLAAVAVLATVVYNMGDSARGATAHAQVREETKGFFTTGVRNCLTRVRGDLSTCNAARLTTVSISPLTSTATPCGDTWSAVATAPSVVVTYPLDECVDNDSFGTDLATDLSILHKVTATYDTTTDDLIITYSR